MGNLVSSTLLKTFGWKVGGKWPIDAKCVVISVPHTSMMDFIWGKLAFSSLGDTPRIFY